jgi:23S rRNA (adenine2030-N6)-methyltransferase
VSRRICVLPEPALNYRHAFHAGNFADVFKHAVLCRILVHLRDKPAAFRVIDTHAGAGLYDLAGPEAERNPEWRDGIGRLQDATLPAAIATLMAPYLEAVSALNSSGPLRNYPGSPILVRNMLRSQDRMIVCELEPKAAVALRRNLRGDLRIKTLEVDGWTALAAHLPPVERRGLVLVDPPYEQDGDFVRLTKGLETACRRWATGIYMLWYPIKGRPEPDALAKRLRRLGIPKILRSELIVSPLRDPGRLNGSGVIVVNPPWTLEADLSAMLPGLAAVLGKARPGTWTLDWLAGETAVQR